MDSINPAEIAHVPTPGVRRLHEAPPVAATEDTLRSYGHLVHDPKSFPIEIVRWPAQGWQPIDKNSGNQGGVTEGIFEIVVCDGSCGLYIHPNVWHGPIVPLDDRAELLDRQGRAHARVSVDFPKEFGCYLAMPLPSAR